MFLLLLVLTESNTNEKAREATVGASRMRMYLPHRALLAQLQGVLSTATGLPHQAAVVLLMALLRIRVLPARHPHTGRAQRCIVVIRFVEVRDQEDQRPCLRRWLFEAH